MPKKTLAVVLSLADSEHVNTTIDALLRQTYKPLAVHALFDPSNKNVASILSQYGTKSLVLVEQSDLSASAVKRYAQDLESDYISIVPEGSVFLNIWASRNMSTLNKNSDATHVVTNQAVIDSDGIVLLSTAFVTLAEWAMAASIKKVGNTPAIFYKKTAGKKVPHYVFSDDCYYAVRKNQTSTYSITKSTLKSILHPHTTLVLSTGIEAHRKKGDEREDHFIALYAAVLKQLARSPHFATTLRALRSGVRSQEHRSSFQKYLLMSQHEALDFAFGNTKEKK